MTPDANGHEIAIGEIVQIDPDSDRAYGGCLIVVEDLTGGAVEGNGTPGGGAGEGCA